MKAFTLILMAALCGTAAADPDRRVPYDHPYDHHADRDHHRNREWTQLMSTTPARGQEFVNLGYGAGRIDQLRIVADNGRVFVRNVLIVFRDGSTRWYSVNRTLRERGDATATIQLDVDRPIARLAVNAREAGRGGGMFSVYGA